MKKSLKIHKNNSWFIEIDGVKIFQIWVFSIYLEL
jgi:hypothetical protein